MTRSPGSQSHALIAKKRQLAAQLLARGLTVKQVSIQLNCSATFVRRIHQELRVRAEKEPWTDQVDAWNGMERRIGLDRRSGRDRRSTRRVISDRRRGGDRRH